MKRIHSEIMKQSRCTLPFYHENHSSKAERGSTHNPKIQSKVPAIFLSFLVRIHNKVLAELKQHNAKEEALEESKHKEK